MKPLPHNDVPKPDGMPHNYHVCSTIHASTGIVWELRVIPAVREIELGTLRSVAANRGLLR